MELEPPDFTRLRLAFRDSSHGDAVRAFERRRARGELEALRVGVLRPVLPPLATIEGDERYLESRRRYLDLISAVGLTRRSAPVVFSHRSALAILGLPTVAAWGRSVDVLEPATSARRSKHGVRVHRTGYLPEEIMPWGPFFVTTPARTIADLARSGDFMSTVVALDAALRPTARSLVRLSKSDVAEVLSRHGDWGLARAEFAVEFADGRAANAGESASRVTIYQLGYEVPDLQVRHFHAEGYFDVDFKWRRGPGMPRPLIGEFDGGGKYVKPEYLGGMTPGEAVLKEKRREDILRRQDNDFGRWGWPEVRHPIDLDRILRECGLRPIRRRLI
jgi:hypothetical protein